MGPSGRRRTTSAHHRLRQCIGVRHQPGGQEGHSPRTPACGDGAPGVSPETGRPEWAGRVARRQTAQFCRSHARGIVDREVIDEAGCALLVWYERVKGEVSQEHREVTLPLGRLPDHEALFSGMTPRLAPRYQQKTAG